MHAVNPIQEVVGRQYALDPLPGIALHLSQLQKRNVDESRERRQRRLDSILLSHKDY